ncbi:MAG: MobF family relaxase [Candidatus Omnitrophota bacterium]
MMSLRALGNLSGGGSAAKLAATYYQEHSADYYVEDLDQQGAWMGGGAQMLGLNGAVERKEFQLGLAGYVAGHEVQNAGKENRQMGWDLTFSAPKSVSIAWAGADGDLKREIAIAHEKAVETAFGYLETHTMTRRGRGGAQHEYTNLVAARFNHHTSRQGDPQLHSHVVVTNFAVRGDRTVGTLESKTFYDHKMAAGALYQTELAWQMRQMGFEIEEGSKGTFRLKDVTMDAEKLFSKRSQQIDKLTKEYGINTYAGTRGIVLSTRPDKEVSSLLEREEVWTKEAKDAGVDINIQRQNSVFRTSRTDHEILTQAGEKLTAQESTFQEKELLRETARAALGERSGQAVLELVTTALEKGYVVDLDKRVLTTPQMAQIEQGIMAQVERMVKKDMYGIDPKAAIDQGVQTEKGKYSFSQEQETAIKTATGISGIAVIQGRAGTGKSTMLAAVRQAYEQEGWSVEGIAFSGQAAQSLQKGSGIGSRTIHSWMLQKDVGERTVIIMDEAGMVGSKQMADVLQKVNKTGAKLVLVGDERQLQPIAAGGILHAIDQKISKIAPEFSTVIEDIQRQKDAWMKEVVKAAAQGRTAEVLESLDKMGKIDFYPNAQEARSALIDEYIAKNREDFSKGMIVTNRTYDALKINEEIREKLQGQGLVEKNGIEFSNGPRKISVAKGDRVIFTRNDYKLDVRNGQRAMVEQVTPDGVSVVFDDGQKKQINVKEYNHLEHGWATTTHKAQGATVDRAIVYGFSNESMASAQATYVQISRAREDTKLYIVAGERGIEREGSSLEIDAQERKEVLDDMKKGWSYNAAKDTTLEHVPLRQQQEIKNELKQERGIGIEM